MHAKVPAGLMAAVLLAAFGPTQSQAQESKPVLGQIQMGGQLVSIRVRVGDAFVYEALEPPPGREPKGGHRYQWYVVQDSSVGLVFTEPSGVKTEEGFLNGDIDVEALRGIQAIEFGVITFNVWDEYTGTWHVTTFSGRAKWSEFSLNPQFRPCLFDSESPIGITCYNVYKHYTSIIYVSRIKYSDGSILVADIQPALEAAQLFSADVTVQDLEPEEPLIPQWPEGTAQT